MANIGTTGAILPSWFKKLVTNSNGGEMYSVAVDDDGYIYVCGTYLAENPFTFEGITLPASPNAGWRNGFYAKFAADGTFQWIKTLKSADLFVFCNAIKVDANYLYVSGSYVSTSAISLDNGKSLPISNGIDGFMLSVAKADGSTQWTMTVGGGNNDQQTAIAVDGTNVYFAGSYSQPMTFNASVSLPAPYVGADSCIVAMEKSSGTVLWAKAIPGLGSDEAALGVATYGSAVYVSTYYNNFVSQTLQVSPEIVIPPTKVRADGAGTTTPLLLKYNAADGSIEWVKYFETDRDQSAASTVAADSTGVYIGGNYCLYASIDLGNGVTLPASLSDVPGNQNTGYVIKYNHSGVAQWSRVINSTNGYCNVATVYTDANYVYVGGGYYSSVENTSFNSLVTFPANGVQSAFIYCCHADGAPIWTDILLNSANTITYGVAKVSDGIVVAYRHGSGGATIGKDSNGNDVIPTWTAAASPLLVKYRVENPVITAANVDSIVTSSIAMPTNVGAAEQMQSTATALATASVVQMISDNQTAVVIGKASGVEKLSADANNNDKSIVSSADGNVAIMGYTPSTSASSTIDAVAIAIKNITNPTDIAENITSDVTLAQLTKIAVTKYDAAGNKIYSQLGNSATYDTMKFDVTLSTSGTFGFIHTSSSGVKTLLTASINFRTATVGDAIPLDGAAGATMTLINLVGDIATIEYYGPFQNLGALPLSSGNTLIQQGNNVVVSSGTVPCFTAGTKILTPNGMRRIETISVGDKVMTADGRVVPAVVYQRKLICTNEKTAPYHIPAGTFGRNQPEDLLISPLHAVQIRKGVWEIPRAAAARYPAITQKMVGEPVTYYHIETPNYFRDNLVANGCIVESFGLNQAKRIPKGVNVYTYNANLRGFTRFSPVTSKSV